MILRGLEVNAAFLNAATQNNAKKGVEKQVISEFERLMQSKKDGYAVGENVDMRKLNSGVDMLLQGYERQV